MKYLLIILWLYPDGTVQRQTDEAYEHYSVCSYRALHHELTDRLPLGIAMSAICVPVRES